MAVIGVPGRMPGLKRVLQEGGHQVEKVPPSSQEEKPRVDLIIARAPRLVGEGNAWIRSVREAYPFSTSLFAITSGGVKARVELLRGGADRCFLPSESPEVVAEYVNSFLRMESRRIGKS